MIIPNAGYVEMDLVSLVAEELQDSRYSDQPAWSIVQVTAGFKRASKYYTQRFMKPQMITTFASFSAFWVSPQARERLTFGALLLLTVLVLDLICAPRVPVISSSLTMTGYFSMNLYFCIAALLVSSMSIALWNKSDRRLFSCTVKAPARWRPPEDIRSKADIEIANAIEAEKSHRCAAKTDLSAFLQEKKMEQYEMAFREQEIHTLEELKECRLTEDDLRDVLKVEPLYSRKVLARHIRELYPNDDPYRETNAMDPMIGALIRNIQDGLESSDALEEKDEEDFVAVIGKAPPPPEPEVVEDPDRKFDSDDYSEYWQAWSGRLDGFASIMFPLVFMVALTIGDYTGKTF